MATSRKPTPAAKPEPKDLGGTIGPQADLFKQAQGEIAEEIERYTSRWIERRHDTAKATLEAVEELGQAKPGLGSYPTVLQAWQGKTVECIAEDISDWFALWRNCAGIVTAGEINAESDLLKLAGMSNQNGKLPTRIPV